jgi:hypothetical protein
LEGAGYIVREETILTPGESGRVQNQQGERRENCEQRKLGARHDARFNGRQVEM